MVYSILFTDARTEVLANTSDATVPGFGVDNDDIIYYSALKQQLVGISNWQHEVDKWKISVKYDAVVNTIMDNNGYPRYLDAHQILNKYMVYIKTDKGNFAAFILSQTQQIDVLANTYTFEAVPMMGVIAKYQSVKPSNYIGNAMYQNVPHTITINDELISYMQDITYYENYTEDDILNDIPALRDVYLTIVLNIFSNNGMQYDIHPFYRDDALLKKWFANSNTLAVRQRKHLYLGWDVNQDTTQLQYNVNTYAEDDGYFSWRKYIHNYIGFNPNYNPNYNTSTTSYGAKVILDDWYTSNPNYTLGKYQYVERYGIAFVQDDNNGLNWSALRYRLYINGFFGDSMPLQITSSIAPDPLPTASMYVIGYQKNPPDWVISNGNPYQYRLPSNQDKLISLYLMYEAFGFTYINTHPNTFKSCRRRIRFDINPVQISEIGNIQDTGWEKYSGNITDDWFDETYRYTFIDQNLIDDPLNYGSDTYILANNDISMLTTYTDNERTMTIVPNTMQFSIDTVLYNLVNKFAKDKQIILSQFLKQLLILQYAAIIPTRIASIYYYYGCTTVTKYLVNSLSLVDISQFYNINDDDVQSFKYVYHINQEPTTIWKYDMLQKKALNDTAVLSYIKQLSADYKRKMIIRLIGTNHPIDLFDNRYVIFNNFKFQIISIAYEENSTVIQCIGKYI